MADQLIGKFNHSVDAKGRLIIPAKLRDALGSRFILIKGIDSCINGYSKEEWNRIGSEIMELDSSDPEVRDLQRFFNFSGIDVELDGQGRIIVPTELREYAEITKDVVVGGNGNKIEIWSREKYEEKYSNAGNMADMMSKLQSKGIRVRF